MSRHTWWPLFIHSLLDSYFLT